MRRLLAAAVSIALAMTACVDDEESPPRRASPPPVTESPTRSPSPQESSPRVAFPSELRLVREATLEQPLGIAVRPGDPTLYVAQKTGEVIAIRRRRVDPRPVLDLSGEVSQGGEQGLLGLAFSPNGARLYTNHTDLEGDTRVTEWTMDGGYANPASRREVLSVDQPYSNHNGGNLVFGPDGYLYIGLGDGGSANDPMANAQSLDTLLGKMLRIDPRPRGERPYIVPRDNPFVGRSGARPEIWAFGLRNPWRYSFDRDAGDLWIGDVGQQAREEIDRQRASSRGGENYGWDRLEGTLAIEGEPPPRAVPPVFEYGRDQGGTVIGGYVYRGTKIPGLVGTYVFGDLFNPELRALRMTQAGLRERELGISVSNLVSFGEDNAGELYALSLSGPIFRIAPR
ncbi:MAG: PQQ-dependent sugar dehydrogenase [Actinomycetota bacterium]